MGIFSQSQLHTYLVKSHNNMFRGVNWKILRLSEVLLQFTEKGGDDCFDVIHGLVPVIFLHFLKGSCGSRIGKNHRHFSQIGKNQFL
jgi:hypothetical protein